MICGACGHDNRAGAKFCGSCGSSLARVCPGCGTPITENERFCTECGVALTATEAPSWPAAVPVAGGERKHITVLFADVAGSMELQEQLDAEVWAQIMGRFFAILAEGVRRFGGTVDKFTGDGIMALFGAPVAQEDHARRACHAAWHLTGVIAAYSEELRQEQGVELHVRLGLNSGEVVVGRVGDDVALDPTALGHTVGLAQRIESLAVPGSVYLTGATADLVGGYFELRDLGPAELKGVQEPVRVLELAGPGAFHTPLDVAAARGLSRFVGRQREMAVLEAALADAASGDGRMLGVVAEPGVGKSRLCHEFAERCRAAGIEVFAGHGLAHTGMVPFVPVLELLRGQFGIDHDDPATARAKVAREVLDVEPGAEGVLLLLYDFLGIADPDRAAPAIDPEARQRQIFGVLDQIRRARSAGQTFVMVVEDLHWLDAGSQAFLEHVVNSLPGTRALLVTTFRPEYRAPWSHRPQYAQLPLAPLEEQASQELLRNLLGSHPSLKGMAELVRERTGGNPFFAEEVVHGLVEDGSLVGQHGSYQLRRCIDEITIPATVKAVVAARIDRLGEPAKGLLQTASVIGRRFSKPLLSCVYGQAESQLDAPLTTLLETGMIYETSSYPEQEYAFKHALIEEIAYGIQLSTRRVQIHAATAKALVDVEADKQEERAALVAYHYDRAGDLSEAVRWTARAAQRAGVNDPAGAARHWRRVRVLTDQLGLSGDTTELAVKSRLELLGAHWRLGAAGEDVGVPFEQEAADVFGELDRIAAATGQAAVKVFARMAYGAVHQLGFGIHKGHELWMSALEAADETGDPALRAVARMGAWGLFVLGRIRDARGLVDKMATIIGDDRSFARGMIVASPYGWTRLQIAHLGGYCGRLDDGLAGLDEVIALLEEEGDDECCAWAHRHWAVFADLAGVDPDLAAVHAEKSVRWAEEAGGAWSRIFTREGIATSHVQRGEWTAAIQIIDEALAMISARRVALAEVPLLLAIRARAQLGLGDPVAARSSAERAMDVAVRAGTRFYEAQARHQLARAILADPPPASEEAAETELDRALYIVETLGIRSYVPHVRLGRANLARTFGDHLTYDEELRAAYRRFLDVGATGHAQRLEAELSARARP